MSSADNTTKLGNADFVFFRFEVGGAPMATRYGPTTMMFDPSLRAGTRRLGVAA